MLTVDSIQICSKSTCFLLLLKKNTHKENNNQKRVLWFHFVQLLLSLANLCHNQKRVLWFHFIQLLVFLANLCLHKIFDTDSAFSLSLAIAVRASSNLSCSIKLTTRHWYAFSSFGKWCRTEISEGKSVLLLHVTVLKIRPWFKKKFF